ncbi:hypothetical protein F5Y05DRAFT_409696 [Hypoxylon sp. FL0543]|nr:hypothetical protein F5Y05DRAFT_409696 [Hypoxylon sp. FL0543]
MFIGAPWEIIRADNIIADKCLMEFYTTPRAGTILTSGPETSSSLMQQLLSQTTTTLLPAIEVADKDDARSHLAGTHVDEATNSTLTLSVDGRSLGSESRGGL